MVPCGLQELNPGDAIDVPTTASTDYVNSGFHQTIAGMAVSKACHETILGLLKK